uniref:Uncharacterized protein n=1 Tax=Tolypothrix bouteillei VB521301 TaxID=1479485 RepID=A0A0C1R271_9CYAN
MHLNELHPFIPNGTLVKPKVLFCLVKSLQALNGLQEALPLVNFSGGGVSQHGLPASLTFHGKSLTNEIPLLFPQAINKFKLLIIANEKTGARENVKMTFST